MAEYRFVGFFGEIETRLTSHAALQLNGEASEYAGEYSVKLWFPPGGGKPLRQENWLQLISRRQLHPGGGARGLKWQREISRQRPVPFRLDARLQLESVRHSGPAADELVYQLITPAPEHLEEASYLSCPGTPECVRDLTAYTQLSAWFFQQRVRPLQLDCVEHFSVKDFPIGLLFTVTIPEERLEYRLICGQQPGKTPGTLP